MNKLLAALAALMLLIGSLTPAMAAEIENGVYTVDAVLYIPDFQAAEFREKQLTGVEVSTAAPLEKTLLEMLLKEISEGAAEPYLELRDIGLLAPEYVRSCDTAVIHLTGELLEMDPLSRFTLCQAITNTVCAPGSVKACVILSDGRALSLDEAQSIPSGVFTPNEYADPMAVMSQLLIRHSDNHASLSYRGNTALFYPTAAGHGVVCETRALTYASDSTDEAVKTILTALSESAALNVPAMPLLTDYLAAPPALETVEGTEGVLVLRFTDALAEALADAGVLRSVMMASVTLSLQAYFPWLQGVRCDVADEPVLAIVPVGLYEGANEAVTFERGYMLWQDFAHFILTEIRLYFTDDAGMLSETGRYVPSAWADQPLKLLEQLFSGPTYYDSVSGLHEVFADKEALEAQLTRLSPQDHLISLDFEKGFWLRQDALREEQSAVYAMVNTLTKLHWCRRVRLTVGGALPEGQLSYETPFMRSMDYTPVR